MIIKLLSLIFAFSTSLQAYAWEPIQADAKKVSISYDLFHPFGETVISTSVDEAGFMEYLRISTQLQVVEIPKSELSVYRHPSLADLEVMHYGEASEDGLGGTFSVCIPYGRIKRVPEETYWQRALISVRVTPEEENVTDIPISTQDIKYMSMNGCEVAGMEVYGF